MSAGSGADLRACARASSSTRPASRAVRTNPRERFPLRAPARVAKLALRLFVATLHDIRPSATSARGALLGSSHATARTFWSAGGSSRRNALRRRRRALPAFEWRSSFRLPGATSSRTSRRRWPQELGGRERGRLPAGVHALQRRSQGGRPQRGGFAAAASAREETTRDLAAYRILSRPAGWSIQTRRPANGRTAASFASLAEQAAVCSKARARADLSAGVEGAQRARGHLLARRGYGEDERVRPSGRALRHSTSRRWPPCVPSSSQGRAGRDRAAGVRFLWYTLEE